MTVRGAAPADEHRLPGEPVASLQWPVEPDEYVSGPADITGRVTASFDLMAAVLDGAELRDLLDLVVTRARHLAGARLAFVALPAAHSSLVIDFAAGLNADTIRGLTVRVGTSVIGRAFTSRRALASQVATNPALKGLPAGPILLLPLDTGQRVRGVLALAGGPGDLQFSPAIRRQLLIFARTSSIVIEMAEERRAANLHGRGR